MDAITAFGIAAGVLQLVDVSFKALSKCQEIYKDGSLAKNRNTENVIKLLKESTSRLEESLHNASRARCQIDTDIIGISALCSKTAGELLTELEKLHTEPGGGRRQAFLKGIRTLRKRDFIAESHEKLESYRRILDTRILIKLNSRTIQQLENFQSLDQSVKDLATALDLGNNTVLTKFRTRNTEIAEHIDPGMEDQVGRTWGSLSQLQFKDSLFFPELLSRQESIHVAHEGTCRWIFAADGSEGQVGSQCWPSFVDWLEHGEEPYWLNGKPGSGKSTLMKYIIEEFRVYLPENHTILAERVTASFFFWSPGCSLQKTLEGLLRSILYQIADQRPDLVTIMMDRPANSTNVSTTCPPLSSIHAWTEARLLNALKCLLVHLPSIINLYIFIDGLDEFDGEEDNLLDLVRLLNSTRQVKVCVSSRPEQVFRLGFAQSPQIKLQDLNLPDITKAAEDILRPTLTCYFPMNIKQNESLIRRVIYKAQGVFLWLDLMAKSLKKGARNADTLDELHKRLEETPDTIEGLYQHMLDVLDASYTSEAFRYFVLLGMRDTQTILHLYFAENESLGKISRTNRQYFTTADFLHKLSSFETRLLTRCAGLVEIDYNRESDYTYGVSTFAYDPEDGSLYDLDRYELHDAWRLHKPYNAEETNIRQTREADVVAVSPDEQNPVRYLRNVRFIHKSVGEFLRKRHPEPFNNADKLLAAISANVRGQLGVMNIIPAMTSLSKVGQKVLDCSSFIESITDSLIEFQESEFAHDTTQVLENIVSTTVSQLFQDMACIDAALNGPISQWPRRYISRAAAGLLHDDTETHLVDPDRFNMIDTLPFHDCSGFAGFLGYRTYVLHTGSLNNQSYEQMNYLLACTVMGLQRSIPLCRVWNFVASFPIILELLRSGANGISTTHIQRYLWANELVQLSVWTAFLNFLVSILRRDRMSTSSSLEDSTSRTARHLERVNDCLRAIMVNFLTNGADANSSIYSYSSCHTFTGSSRSRSIDIASEETPLSLLESTTASCCPDLIETLNDTLRAHGGCSRKHFRYVRLNTYDHILPQKGAKITLEEEFMVHDRWYRLSEHQTHSLGDLRDLYPECFDCGWPPEDADPEVQNRVEEFLLGIIEHQLAAPPDAKKYI